jgi:uncharacterized protein YlxW (UPF0749 family)
MSSVAPTPLTVQPTIKLPPESNTPLDAQLEIDRAQKALVKVLLTHQQAKTEAFEEGNEARNRLLREQTQRIQTLASTLNDARRSIDNGAKKNYRENVLTIMAVTTDLIELEEYISGL